MGIRRVSRGGSKVCVKCENAEVQDETHALFYCNCFEVCELRRKYKDCFFINLLMPLHTFARLPITDNIPLLAKLVTIFDAGWGSSTSSRSARVSGCRPIPCNPCNLHAAWPNWVSVSTGILSLRVSKLSKPDGMALFLLPVIFVMPKMASSQSF
eukprot:1152673-Pelagomonas_calceolata.AAC.1